MNLLRPHSSQPGLQVTLRALLLLLVASAAIFLARSDAASAANFKVQVDGDPSSFAAEGVPLRVEGARSARNVTLFVDGNLRKRDRSWPWSFGERGKLDLRGGVHRLVAVARFRGDSQTRRKTVVVGAGAPLRRIADNKEVAQRRKRETLSSSALPDGVLWEGDFETGSLSQWPIVQQVASDRITIAQDPTRQGNFAARFEVRPGDNIGDTAPRAEVAAELGEQENEERYYRWFTYFDPAFPTEFEDSFVTFTQWRSTDESDAFSSFMVWGDEIELRRDGTRWEAPLVKGVWHEFIYHVKWSPDPNVGFIELWYDGQLAMPKTYIETMAGEPGAGVENYVKQGLYKSDEIPTGVVYHDGFVAGTSFAAVSAAP